MRRLSRTLLSGVIFAALFAVPTAVAKPGDLYVGDPAVSPEPARIVKINHRNGHQRLVASGGKLVGPDAGVFGSPGKLLIADYNAFAGDGAIFRVNIGTGSVHTVSKDPAFRGPTDLTLGENGKLFAVDPFAGAGAFGAVFRINQQTGDATNVSDDDNFNGGPLGIVTLPSGKLLVADQDAGPSDSGALIKVDPATGAQNVVASGGDLDDPYGVTLSGDGKTAFVADAGKNEIIRVKLASADQQVIADLGGPNWFAGAITLGLDGKLYATSYTNTHADVFKIDRHTGDKSVFASQHHLLAPEGITVQPRG
jgi:hypothetical protein